MSGPLEWGYALDRSPILPFVPVNGNGHEHNDEPKLPVRGEPEPQLVRLSDVKQKPVRWLWKPRLHLGGISIVRGDPGDGKSSLLSAIIASLTQGTTLEQIDGEPQDDLPPSNVVLLSAEDHLECTLAPRLDRYGADLKRITSLTGSVTKVTRPDGTIKLEERGVTLKDIDVIERAITREKARLVVVDTLANYLGGADQHRQDDMAPLLKGIAGIAEKHECCVVLIEHLNKDKNGRAIHRGIGSMGIAGASRNVGLVGRDPTSPETRVFSCVKSNVGKEWGSVAFVITEDGDFEWKGPSKLKAADLLRGDQGENDSSARDEAREWLKAELAGGARPTKELEKEARRAGHAWRTVRRASKDLEVQIRKQHEPGSRGQGSWVWVATHPVGHLEARAQSTEGPSDKHDVLDGQADLATWVEGEDA
jgi:putative DNA primase/helicase